MKVLKTIAAGRNGSKRYLDVWGDRLINVRYRESPDGRDVVTTVELVVDERPKLPPGQRQNGYLAARARETVGLSIAMNDVETRAAIKRQGGKWDKQLKLWIIDRAKAVAMGLKRNIVAYIDQEDDIQI